MSPPEMIDRYHIEREIGRGGIGVVYLAHDPMLGRKVAIKVLRGDFDEQARHLFLRGAQVLGSLRHSNIVIVHECGHSDGQPFIVMEYIVGESLRTAINQRARLSVSRKLEIIDGVCKAMAYTHGAQVIHRDLKPENIMLEAESGVAKIVDFDLSRSLGTNASRFTQGVGTVRYMAPEQFLGQTDSRSDIFSIGAVAYELLSHSAAFEGDAAAAMHKIFEEKPASLARRVPGLDARLVRIVHRALAKKPHTRYQKLEDMSADLAAVRSSLDPTMVLNPAEERADSPFWKRRTSIFAVGVGVLLVTWIATRPNQPRPESVVPFTPLTGSNGQVSTDSLMTVREPGGGTPSYELKRFVPFDTPQHAVAMSTVPRLLVRVADFETTIRVSELTTGREVRTFSGGALLLSVTQDGKRLAAIQPQDTDRNRSVLRLWQVATGQDIRVLELQESSVRSIAFSASGENIAIATAQNVRVVNVASGVQLQEVQIASPISTGALEFSPDERLLAWLTLDGTLQLWNIRTGRTERSLRFSATAISESETSQLAFNPAGTRLAVASPSQGVGVWDLSSGDSGRAQFRRAEAATAIAFSPEGSWLVSAGGDSQVTFWDLEKRQYFQALARVSTTQGKTSLGRITSLSFSPDGQLLVVGTVSGAGLWQRVP